MGIGKGLQGSYLMLVMVLLILRASAIAAPPSGPRLMLYQRLKDQGNTKCQRILYSKKFGVTASVTLRKMGIVWACKGLT